MGQVVRGYELTEQIGAGGFGAVYRAYQAAIKREVAIKVILPAYANQPDFILRFHTEAELIGRLEHPHIVPLYDYWQDDSGAYLVMRWMRGGSLRDYLTGPLDRPTLLRWVEQLAQALHAAHRNGVVHRDLKPENILLDEDGNTYLADFGIAKDIALKTTSQTQNPFTPIYAAPEQFSADPVTPATDIYAFGIMIYELLNGAPPFNGTLSELVYAHINNDLPELHIHHQGIPPGIDYVLRNATAKAPEDRFQSALELLEAFKAQYENPSGTPVAMRQVTPTAASNPFFHRGPIRESDYFFGRENETRQLVSLLQTGQSVSIIGQRRIGKTSLLHRALDRKMLNQYGLNPDEYVIVYLDCGSLITLEQSEIYRLLLEEIEDALFDKNINDIEFESLREDKPVTYRDFERSLRRMFRSQLRLALLLDEFELLSRNEHLGSEFFTGLRALAMRHPLTYVTASKQPLLALTYADASTLSSPFFNIFATITLMPFSDKQAANMLTELSQRVNQPFDESIISHLSTLAGGHPLFLQIAGYHALEIQHDTGNLDLLQLNEQFRDKVTPHLEYYWRSLSHDEQRVLLTLTVSGEREPDIVHHLQQMCLIMRAADGIYRPFSPVFKDFIFSRVVSGLPHTGEVVINEERREVICYGNILELTPLQFDLLGIFITYPGQVLTNEDLEQILWGDQYVDDPERLKSVIKGLRRTLGNYADHIENVRGVGYQWRLVL